MNVLIVPDKFKGSITAGAAAKAISRGWRKSRPKDQLTLLPMSDGGDGFGEVLGGLAGAKQQRTRTVDAAHRPCTAPWWWAADNRIAIVESARVIGLVMLPRSKFHPFVLDTFGLGAVFEAAARKGARKCLVGIGGSATNDGGFGLARALGWRFIGRDGEELESWSELHTLASIQRPARQNWFKELSVAVDVKNPLLGPRGATRVYGPQKGLRPEDFPKAERCLSRLAAVYKRRFGTDLVREPGAGAAGGLGFGLAAFMGARLEPGFELFARSARLDQHLREADLVITGEGSIDRSTLMGKGVGQIARRCLELKKPCIGLGGVVHRSAQVRRMFSGVRALCDITTEKEALARASNWLELLARDVAHGLVW